MKKLTLLLALTMILFSCKPEPEKPTVATKSVGEVTETTAKVVGQVTADGGAEVTERGVCWNTAPAPEVIDYRTKDAEGGLGFFTLNLSNLEPQTPYYVRAYATNEKGTAYGEEINFTTGKLKNPELPIVVTSKVDEITHNSAICGGDVSDGGGVEVTVRGVCWSTDKNPTIGDECTMDGKGIGVFTSYLQGLKSNTTYYVRAYATNEKGTAYGEEINFTTGKETCPITGKINGYPYVDLGLSVKWASYNVGATLPEEYGNYYSWGEIKTKNEYTQNNCLSEGVDIGFDIAGNAQYDAATVNWGGTWRMPRLEELTELSENCIWESVVMNGVNGYKVIGKNGNYIFLPVAGFLSGTELLNDERMGYIWCSETLNQSPYGNAYVLEFYYNYTSHHYIFEYGYRSQGYSVRPVLE